MAQLVKQVNQYNIFLTDNHSSKSVPFIIHNTNLPFAQGHCHVKTEAMVNSLIKCVEAKEIPEKSGPYYLRNLSRIADDEKYRKKLKRVIKKKEKEAEKNRRHKKH